MADTARKVRSPLYGPLQLSLQPLSSYSATLGHSSHNQTLEWFFKKSHLALDEKEILFSFPR